MMSGSAAAQSHNVEPAGMSEDEQEFSGLTWGMTLYVDVVMPLTVKIMTETQGAPLGDGFDDPLTIASGPLVSVAGVGAAVGFGFAMGPWLEIPADVPFVLHNAAWGAIGPMMFGCGLQKDSKNCLRQPEVLVMGGLGFATMAAYSALRLDDFIQSGAAPALLMIPQGAAYGAFLIGGGIIALATTVQGKPFNTEALLLTMGATQTLSYAILLPLLENLAFEDTDVVLLPTLGKGRWGMSALVSF